MAQTEHKMSSEFIKADTGLVCFHWNTEGLALQPTENNSVTSRKSSLDNKGAHTHAEAAMLH